VYVFPQGCGSKFYSVIIVDYPHQIGVCRFDAINEILNLLFVLEKKWVWEITVLCVYVFFNVYQPVNQFLRKLV
jgi:hypothetical protein